MLHCNENLTRPQHSFTPAAGCLLAERIGCLNNCRRLAGSSARRRPKRYSYVAALAVVIRTTGYNRCASPLCMTGSMSWGGAEKVLKSMLSCFPSADVFCLFDVLTPQDRASIGFDRATTSFLQRMPASARGTGCICR